MTSDVYEVVGAVDRAAAEALAVNSTDADTIFVDDGDDEYLIARPRDGDSDG